MTEPLLHSRRDAARLLGISVRTLDYLIQAKELSVRRCGARVLVPHAECEKFARRDHSTRPGVTEVNR
jgi:excisionase family DNA binding protein